MGEIHELFVSALSLVWFAGATPECGLTGFFFSILYQAALCLGNLQKKTIEVRQWHVPMQIAIQANMSLPKYAYRFKLALSETLSTIAALSALPSNLASHPENARVATPAAWQRAFFRPRAK